MASLGVCPQDVPVADLQPSKTIDAPVIVAITELDGPSPPPSTEQRPEFFTETVAYESIDPNIASISATLAAGTTWILGDQPQGLSETAKGKLVEVTRPKPKRQEDSSDDVPTRKHALSMPMPTSVLPTDNPHTTPHTRVQSENSRRNVELERTTSGGSQNTLPSPAYGSTPLLTPPEEKEAFFPMNSHLMVQDPATLGATTSTHISTRTASVATYTATSRSEQNSDNTQSSSSETSSQSARNIQISLPVRESVDQNHVGPESWLGRAINRAVLSVGETIGDSDYATMVAQILPVRVVRSAIQTKAMFELVLEAVQRRIDNPQFSVNITHAVPRMISMDEVPTSPPATPQFSHGARDYFDLQTVFSLAGVVPLYHAASSNSSIATSRTSTPITARRSVDVSVLERYIPPVSASEVRDFFTNGGKSYLVDRLAEVKLRGGTLLLVYPTKTGAQTFISRYLNPILEPVMRRFIFYHGLFPYLGDSMGTMEAVASTLEFEQLSLRISSLCQTLSAEPLEQYGPHSNFNLVYSDVGELNLERSDWLEYWIHQEQPRLKADLVQYQKTGGRMPSPIGLHEATPASLSRELTDAMSKSTEPCGGVGIEVGVFVIQRSPA